MPKIITKQLRCSVKLTWTKPDNGGTPINSYKIEVKAKDKKFTILETCGKDAAVFGCEEKLETFGKAPYNLKVGDLIEFRVSAKNTDGWGIPSLLNTDGVTMSARPGVAAPKLDDQTYTSASLSWKKVIDTQKYIIFQSSEKFLGAYLKIAETDKTSFKVETLALGKIFSYKIKAQNACGQGEFSPGVKVELDNQPAEMLPITTSRDACSIKLAWTKPIDGGSPITSYKIEVQGSKGKFHVLDSCGDGKSLGCTLRLDSFFKKPFNLKEGDLIVA